MLKTIALTLTFAITSGLFASEVIETHGKESPVILGKKLTPFWAQEYAGVDLVKSELEAVSWKQQVPVAVFDLGFERDYISVDSDVTVDYAMNGRRRVRGHHGTSVANLISGNGEYSASNVVDFVALRRTNLSFLYNYILGEFEELDIHPKLISNSMGWPDESIAEAAVKADKQGIIWVLAGAYEFSDEVRPYENNAPVINVGSYAPSGLMSATAQEFKNIAILSPADMFQASIDGYGEHTLFGESSGATPLVTGALANAISLLPDLTRTEARILLKNTAYPSLRQAVGSVSKAGLLNSYKLYRVAKRIAEQCGYDDGEISKSDSLCKESLIASDSSYRFSKNASAFSELNSKFFGDTQYSAKEKSEALIKARKAISLNSDDAAFLELLSRVYISLGYEKNGEFFHHLSLIQTDYKSRIGEMKIEALKAIDEGKIELSYLRHVEHYGDRVKNALKNLLENGDEDLDRSTIQNLLKKMR